MKKFLLIAILALLFVGCTENQNAKAFGGKASYTIPQNEEFINMTWKETNLWIITKEKDKEVYHMREKSDYGVWEGHIIISHEQ